MPFVAVPDKNSGDVFTTAMWTTYLEGNLNAGVDRPLFDSGALAIAAASIDITSIPATFAHLLLVAYLRGDTAAAGVQVRMRCNNDSAANYYWQSLVANGTNVVGSEGLLDTSVWIGDAPANTAPANRLSATEVLIANYANSTNRKTLRGSALAPQGTTTGTISHRSFGGTYEVGAAINRLTIFPSAGNWAAGSRLTLYGMGAI